MGGKWRDGGRESEGGREGENLSSNGKKETAVKEERWRKEISKREREGFK